MTQKTAKDIMSKKVITVSLNDTIKNVIKKLTKYKITGAPVINAQRKLMGIITEKDIAKHALAPHFPESITLLGSVIYLENPAKFNDALKKICASNVRDLMSTPCKTLDESTPLQNLIEFMTQENVNRIPITKNNKLVGIVTRTDILKSL
jgi:CBS domain-containing protein